MMKEYNRGSPNLNDFIVYNPFKTHREVIKGK